MNKTVVKVIAWVIVVGITVGVMTPVLIKNKEKSVADVTITRVEAAAACTECDHSYIESDNGFCPSGCPIKYQRPALVTEHDNATNKDYKYYEIANAGQLYWFSKHINDMDLTKNVNADDTDNTVQNAKLVNNIVDNPNLVNSETGELNDAYIENDSINTDSFREWVPIAYNTDMATFTSGSEEDEVEVGYSGEFDGNGYIISGLCSVADYTKNVDGEEDKNKGLFSYLGCTDTYGDAPTIKNLKVLDSYMSSTKEVYVAGIAGNSINAAIEECVFQGSLYGKNVAGIVGEAIGVEIAYCDSEGIYETRYRAGGMVASGKDTNFDNCKNKAKIINSSNNKNPYIGGIIGQNENGLEGRIDIVNCHNYGQIWAENVDYSYVGGIVGIGTEENIVLCSNSGSLKGVKVGGIVGRSSSSNSNIERCFNEGEITTDINNNYLYCGGIAGITYGTVKNCYNAGTIINQYAGVDGCNSHCGGITGEGEDVSYCHNVGEIKDGANENKGGNAIRGNGHNAAALVGCYYLEDTVEEYVDDGDTTDINESEYEKKCNGIKCTTVQLKSGEICYLLNGGDSNTDTTDDAWFQNIEGMDQLLNAVDNDELKLDTYPVLDNTHGKIVKTGSTYGISIDNAVISVRPNTYQYTGDPIGEAPYVGVYVGGALIENTDEKTLYTVEFKKGNETIDDVTQIKEMGEYTVVVTGASPLTGTAKGTFSIILDTTYQEKPEITEFTHETFNCLKDGTISGLNTLMEYSTNGIDYTRFKSSDFVRTDGKVVVEPGTYFIRYAAKDEKKASDSTTITINNGPELTLDCEDEYDQFIKGTDTELSFTSNVKQPMFVSIYDGDELKKDLVVNSDYTFNEGTGEIVVNQSILDTYTCKEGYKLRVTHTSTINDRSIYKEATFKISEKQKQQNTSKPISGTNFTVKDETIKGFEDGAIVAVKNATEMEYKAEDEDDSKYEDMSASVTVKPGKYHIRFKENDDYYASEATEVTISEGEVLRLTKKVDEEYKLGSTSGFTFVTNYYNPEYNPILYIGPEPIKDTDYTVTGTEITLLSNYLEGFEAKKYTLVLKYKDGVEARCDFKVSKQNRTHKPEEGTDYSILNESIQGFKDGAIIAKKYGTGSYEIMEYRLEEEDESEYKEITANSTPVGLGKYFIRFKATDVYNPSDEVEINVTAGHTLGVTASVDKYTKDGGNSEDAGITFTPTESVWDVMSDPSVNIDPVIKIKEADDSVSEWTILVKDPNNNGAGYKVSGKTFYLTKKYLDTLSANKNSTEYVVSIGYTKGGNTASASDNFTVEKKDQDKPDSNTFTTKKETVKGFEDGKITTTIVDVTNLWYKLSSGEEYKLVPDTKTVTELGAGEYKFIYKSTNIYKESDVTTVTVGFDKELKLERVDTTNDYKLGSGDGYRFKTNYYDSDSTNHPKFYVGSNHLSETVIYTVSGTTDDTEITLKSTYLDSLGAGTHTLKIMYNKGSKPSATCEFTCVKQDKAAPTGITTEDESIKGFEDGKIKGLTTDLVYRAKTGDTWTEWKAVTATEMIATAGDYEFKYPATNTHNESPVTHVNVNATKTLTFDPTTVTYTKNPSAGDDDYGVKVKVSPWNDGLSPVVKFNGATLVKDTSYFVVNNGSDDEICIKAKYLNDLEMNTDSKPYTLELTYTSPVNEEKKATVTCVVTVVKANNTNTVTGVNATDESYEGFNDGIINGLSTDMEYSVGNTNNYQPVVDSMLTSGKWTGRTKGHYFVRYKGDNMYKASEAVDLEVKSGTKITVNTKVTEAYENGLTTDYVFVTNYDEADLATVAAVYVDNKLLADTNYTVANKEITVKSAFLNKLTHGEHSFELRFNKGANPTADVKFNVVKDPQGPPSIKQDDVTNESYEGLDDGKIPGLTTGMEYRKETSTGQWTEWTKVTDEDMTFEAGKYEVRNAETDTQAPSNSVEITVGAGEEIKVTASKTKFIKGDKEGLVFTVNVDYDVKTFNGVKINGNLLPTNMYSVAKGSTIVTLPAVNLELLNAGTYNIAICYKPDVEVTSTFTVEDHASGNTGGNTGGDTGSDDGSGNGTTGGDNGTGNGTTGGDNGTGNGSTGGNEGAIGGSDSVTPGENDGSTNGSGSVRPNGDSVADKKPANKVTGGKTGDNANMWIWIIALTVSALGICGTIIIYTKKRQ